MRFALPCFLSLFALTQALAQTSYPMLTHTTPVVVQQGTTSTITVSGKMNLFGAYKVLVEGEGVEATVVGEQPSTRPAGKLPNITSVKLSVKVAPDAPLGVREFRIATCLGVSSIGQLVVNDSSVVVEKGDNNTRESATMLPMPCAISGRIEKVEDVDFYKFRTLKGQTLTFEVLCARLQDKIHDLQKHADPLIAIYDAEGRELAANDDFFFADAYLSHTFKEAGEYFLQIRDSKFDGDTRWVYALLVTDQPRASHIYPLAGSPGQQLEVEPVGSAGARAKKITITAPAEEGLHHVELPVGNSKTNPVPLIVDSLPKVFEEEENDSLKTANPIDVPSGVSGRMNQARDLDYFVFQGTKGQPVRFEVFARRFGTSLIASLDSVLEILDAKEKVLASSDDSIGKDAVVRFVPPADGDYWLRIRDLNSKGGPTSIYYISCKLARRDYQLRCDPDKAMIGPGSSTTWFVHLVRGKGFRGPVDVAVEGLPKGVTASAVTIPPTMTQGIVVLTANDDVKPAVANVRVVGKAKVDVAGKEETLVRVATPRQEIYIPGGGRKTFGVTMQTVATTTPSDILKVNVKPGNMLKLKPGDEVKLDVEIQRRADYDKAVSIDVLLRHLNRVYGSPLPPGVTIVEGKSKTLLGKANKGHITLKVAKDAKPIERIPLSVLAHVSINFVVKVSYSSEPLWLTITK